MKKKVYLAGPEVFFPKAINDAIVERKKEILSSMGMIGVDPLDNQIDFPDSATPQEMGFLIYEANKNTMDECDGAIANLTPFRGPSADAGTVFEVGYMVSQKKPVMGFTMTSVDYGKRIHENAGRDSNQMEIERFELSDNLMIECGIVNNGGQVFKGQSKIHFSEHKPSDYFDEKLFTEAAMTIKASFDKKVKMQKEFSMHP